MTETATLKFKLEKVVHKPGAKRPRHDVWECTLRRVNDEGHTHVKWEWGVRNGKPQTRERTYVKGLQKRTAWQQALQETNKMIDEKLHKGYGYAADSICIRSFFDREAPEDRDEHTKDDDGELDLTRTTIPFVMLAHDLQKYPHMVVDRCGFLMPKLDGVFAMANIDTGDIWSRSRKPIEKMKHVQEAVLQFGKVFRGSNRWIVGELYRHGWEFQKISGLVRTSKITPEKLEVVFHVFDLMCEQPFEARRSLLESGFRELSQGGNITLVDCHRVANILVAYREYHKICVNGGYEGVMIHPYTKEADDLSKMPGYLQDKRTEWLLKYKEFIQEEYECVGIKPQKHRQIAGSVILKTKDGIEFSATPSMTDESKKEIWDMRHSHVGQIATVKFFSYHPGTQGKPRFPTIIGFRHPDDIGS